MAILLNNAPNNITEYPHSLKRQGAFPLEYYSVFQTLASAKEYAKSSLVAYVGQPIAVTEGGTSYYVIANTSGDLIKLGDGELNVNEINSRLDILVSNDKNKSARTIANEELAEQLLSKDAEASFKTLKELAAWIENHPEDAAMINATLQQLQRDLKSEVQLREAQINGLNFSLKEEINRAKTEEDKIVQYVNKILFETELIIDSNETKTPRS